MAEVEPEELLNVAVLGEAGGQTIQRRKLCEIIEARMGEIYSLIREEVKRSGHAGMLPAGAVLTGGGARLAGADVLARETLEMPVRIGSPQGVGGLMDQIGNPAFSDLDRAAAVGRQPPRRGADRLRRRRRQRRQPAVPHRGVDPEPVPRLRRVASLRRARSLRP